jgi:hypothetical protein
VPDVHPFYFALATKRIGQPVQEVADKAVNAFDSRCREGFRKLISDRLCHLGSWRSLLARHSTYGATPPTVS